MVFLNTTITLWHPHSYIFLHSEYMDITDGNGNRVGLTYEYGIPFNAQGFEKVSFGNSGNITVDIYLKRSVSYLELQFGILKGFQYGKPFSHAVKFIIFLPHLRIFLTRTLFTERQLASVDTFCCDKTRRWQLKTDKRNEADLQTDLKTFYYCTLYLLFTAQRRNSTWLSQGWIAWRFLKH